MMTDTPRHGNVRVFKILRDLGRLRDVVRAEGSPAIQDAFDRMEPWWDAVVDWKGKTDD